MNPPRSHRRALLLVLLPLLTATGASPAGAVRSFKVAMEKWVETRQLISEERSDWEADRELLRATRDLLAQEKEDLKQQITDLEGSASAADEERRELLRRRSDYQGGAEALETEIRAMEEQTLALAPRLPAPLQEKLQPLLVQIPDDPEANRLQLGQRLMNVLGVLAQAEKFNGTATFVGETRDVDDGQKVAVRTLYWGLAQAVFVGAQGRTAGVGRPGEAGWEFVNDAELTSRAGELLDIYEGNVDTIRFVPLPVEVD